MLLRRERRRAMENNRFSRIYNNLPKIVFFVFVLASLIANVICCFYINELESQIVQRDSIISKLTFSNDLVEEYFDIVEDSISQKTIYTLKEDKKIKIFQTKTKYVEHPVVIKPTFVRGEQVLTTDDVLALVNDGDSIYLEKLKTLAKQYNTLINDYNASQKEIRTLKDTIIYQGMALGLIKRNFDIGYTSWHENDRYHVQLEANKADSAFVLFPYFKHKMKYEEKTKSWIIKR